MEFEVAAPTAGWVMITDRWAPGWSASVNGRPARVWGANGLWRAVRLQAGRNVITMWYRPFGYPWLLYVSWMVVAVVLLTTIAAHRRARTAASFV